MNSLLFFLPWYFIPRVLKLASVELYVRNGYDWDSETVNVLARQTALKHWIATEMRWYRLLLLLWTNMIEVSYIKILGLQGCYGAYDVDVMVIIL